MLTQAALKEILDYNPRTGVFVWKYLRVKSHIKVGDAAGYSDSLGYRVIEIGGKAYKAHRLAWLYMTGRFPSTDIDHIDGGRGNNVWVNLREATEAENMQNQRSARKDNKCGILGVYYDRSTTGKKKWRACIAVNGKTINVGRHLTAGIAEQAYLIAKSVLHPFSMIS